MKGKRDTSARDIALSLLYAVEKEGAYASHLFTTLHHRQEIDPRERALAEKIVKGVLEHRSEIDGQLNERLPKGLQSLPPRIQIVLRMGIYQLRYLERVERAVVVDSAVELAKRFSSAPLARLVNAILRRYLREESEPKVEVSPKNADEISKAFSHPLWIVEQWIGQIGTEETIALCKINNEEWPLYIRVNRLKVSKEELIRLLAEEGVIAKPGRFAKDALQVMERKGKIQLHKLRSFQEGLFTVQDEGACLVSEVSFAGPYEVIIDLCAAPGGKTTHLAILNRNEGTILAVDPSEKRLDLVRDNCRRLGITNVDYVCTDGRTLGRHQAADFILVDAPCSGLGVVGRRSDLRWNRAHDTIAPLCALQLELLQHAAQLVKKGGRLVYSTCTTSHEENEGIIEKFLSTNSDFVVTPIVHSMSELLTSEGYLRTWPQRHYLGGGFVALLDRCG
jgi:16S rRNA (cytosine967-C5)-methyltransferase